METESAIRVGILVYEDVDLLEAGGPYEVFITATRLAAREDTPAPFQVVTVGPSLKPITAYGGLRLIPDLAFEEVDGLDVLVVPGTVATAGVVADRSLVQEVGRLAKESSLVASVCGGSFILADLGLLADRPWTVHWEDVAALAERAGGQGQPWARWIDTGDVVTAGGPGSGIAMTLHLVDRLAGTDLAVRTAHQLDFHWDPRSGQVVQEGHPAKAETDPSESSDLVVRLRELWAPIGSRIGLLESGELGVASGSALILFGWLLFDVMLGRYRMGVIPYLVALGLVAAVLLFHLRPSTVWSVPYPTLLRLGGWVIVATALADLISNLRDGVLEVGGAMLAGALLYYLAAAVVGIGLVVERLYSEGPSRSSIVRSKETR